MWKVPPLETILTQPVIMQNMWGVFKPSTIRLGTEWVEQAKMSIELDHSVFNFYRHPELFKSVRVELFMSEYWTKQNNGETVLYKGLTGWANSARRLYSQCYNIAQKKAKELESGS